MAFFGFHPLIEQWFRARFAAPTEPQERGWPAIAAGESTLIAAPTGSGKTLTAFLACIDRLVKEGSGQWIVDSGQKEVGGGARGCPPSTVHRPLRSLPDETRVVYVSPLRALSNDMHRNLEVPLAEIAALAAREGMPLPAIRAGLRTGDTSSSQRAKLVRKPPHILVTTPESLYLLLTSEKGRAALRTVETVIVDEIHALVRDKRGSHLALSLERLEALCGRPLQRIGLSATQKPIERVAQFLMGRRAGGVSPLVRSVAGGLAPDAPELIGSTGPPGSQAAAVEVARNRGEADKDVCPTDDARQGPLTLTLSPAKPGERGPEEALSTLNPRPSTFNSQPSTLDSRLPTLDSPTIVDVGHARALDLAIEVPPSELGAVCMHEQWAEVNERLVELIRAHRSTLIFVNTRRLAERVTHQLTELLGEEVVGAHHGSLAADIRLDTEQRLKEGKLKAVVATASLELGLDIGYIDLVVQLGSPRAIATFLQRIGRSGHSLGLVPKGRLFALTRDELLECMALIRAVRAGRLDAVRIPEAPLDVLAQQIVAEAVGRESDPSPGAAAPGIDTDELFDLFRRAWPYRDLARQDFDRTIEYLSEGIAKQAGRGRTLLHHDQVNRRIRARRGARITATSNGGAIPEVASYRVVAEPEHTVVGTLDEDFAVESNAGDIFLLGNTSWRIHYVRGNDVTVSDAQGAPPTIPFWRGEAPGRTLELSEEVARLRDELENRLDDTTAAARWLDEETSCGSWAAQQAVEYCAAQQGAVGLLPTQKRVVFERFFDETGGMQLVVHAPFGGAINRAWGLAMRKRFCRSFDFELQATADDDGFILSLGPQHSFPIESLFGMLTAENARGLLEQAVLTVPMFQVRWRWNVTRALLVERMRSGKKVPPALQRFRADDLLTAVFPKLTGCQEEHTGDHEIPDHPLARQTMEDCLTEALDLPGLLEVLSRIERGEIQLIARDTREPSPFSYELLNAAPYAFLDGGEAQERRTRAVAMRRSLTVESVHDLGRLDPAAIEQVVREAQPLVRDADELHDALLGRIVLPEEEIADVGSVRRTEPKLASAASVVPPGSARQPATGTSPPPGEASLEMAASMVASGPAGPAGPTFELAADRRAGRFVLPDGRTAWVAAERLPAVEALFSGVTTEPPLVVPEGVEREWESTAARVAVVRGLLEVCGPITAADVAARLCITASQSDAALEALEGEGVVLRGRFSNAECGVRNAESEDDALSSAEWGVGNAESKNDSLRIPHSELRTRIEWCHRRLLARIHRLTLEGLRKQIEPVSRETFLRFLFRHHGVTAGERRSGGNGLFEVVQILQGLDLPAIAWERDVLPARLQDYQPAWLDELCLTGEIGWGRLYPSKRDPDRAKPMASLTRVVPVSLWLRQDLEWLADAQVPSPPLGERVRVRRNGPDDSTARERSSTNDMRRVGMDAVRTDDAREGPLTSPLSPAKPGERGLERPPLDHSDASRANPPSDPATSGGRIANPSASVGQAFEPAENCAAESRRGADKDVCPTDGGRIGNPSYDARTDDDLSGAAQDVFAILQKNGAMFAADLAREARLLPSQLEEALGELIARGHVTADGFAGLRNLIAEKPASRRESLRAGPWRQRRTSAGAGRWSLWRTISGQWTVDSGQNTGTVHRPPSTDHCSHWAWQLLRRWGVVFRDLLVREPGAPRWFELLQVYRRLEARGEIRGGRFVAGVGGEQFALGDSVRALRQLRDEGPQGELVAFSAADPLNLTGILGDDRRVPALATNRVAFLDGTLVAALIAGETQWLADLDETLRRKISKRFGRPVGRIADPSPVVGQAFQPAADSFVESERRADMDVCPTEAGRIANPSCANDDAPPDAAAKDEPPGEDSPPPDRPPRRKRYPNGIPRPMIS